MKRFLIIQTAFTGDVILATPVIEKLHIFYPDGEIDFLLRKGNETLLENHPFINEILIWNKKEHKYSNLIKIIIKIRSKDYDYVINMHRFSTTGIITALSKGKEKIGFDKNPLSFLYDKSVKHIIGKDNSNIHETDRNLALIRDITDSERAKVRLYPTAGDYEKVRQYKKTNYICIAPASVWFTKQYPAERWIEFISKVRFDVYLIGGRNDYEYCENIINKVKTLKQKQGLIYNLAGRLSYLQTAALMKDAEINYTNDSAPLHIASSVNAPVAGVFCSTVPAFGFGPLSDKSYTLEVQEKLNCRPCGLHGFRVCPEKHFKCAQNIKTEQLLEILK